MTSQDVIHSFFVPAFRIKQDVLPGRYTTIWFRPTKVGRYHLFCAEYCGTNHSEMIGWVDVMEPADYERWLRRRDRARRWPRRGSSSSSSHDCAGCHRGSQIVHAPRLEGVYGHPVPIQQGNDVRFVTADDRYIRDSILLPKSRGRRRLRAGDAVVRGADQRADLLKILAYIKSIGEQGAGPMSRDRPSSSRKTISRRTRSRSWLLTTDHKRIGLLYMVSITFFFFVGGAAATLIRLELMTPQGDVLSSPDAYNRLFTMHGVIMIFFFLIPSIPAVLGNFLIPLMIGARDLAFPRLNLLSWYIYMIGGLDRRSGS